MLFSSMPLLLLLDVVTELLDPLSLKYNGIVLACLVLPVFFEFVSNSGKAIQPTANGTNHIALRIDFIFVPVSPVSPVYRYIGISIRSIEKAKKLVLLRDLLQTPTPTTWYLLRVKRKIFGDEYTNDTCSYPKRLITNYLITVIIVNVKFVTKAQIADTD